MYFGGLTSGSSQSAILYILPCFRRERFRSGGRHYDKLGAHAGGQSLVEKVEVRRNW